MSTFAKTAVLALATIAVVTPVAAGTIELNPLDPVHTWRVTSDGETGTANRNDTLTVDGVLVGTIPDAAVNEGFVMFAIPNENWRVQHNYMFFEGSGGDPGLLDVSDILVLRNEGKNAVFYYGSDDNSTPPRLPPVPMAPGVQPEFRNMTILSDGTAEDLGSEVTDVVPEPSTFMLFGAAALVLIVHAKRRT
jgi:hypothetical protein